MKTAKRLAMLCGLLLGLLVVPFIVVIAMHQVRILSYDRAFRAVHVGDSSAVVFARMGDPQKTATAATTVEDHTGIHSYVVYRVGQKLNGGVTWTLGLDKTGRVIRKHRDANGC